MNLYFPKLKPFPILLPGYYIFKYWHLKLSKVNRISSSHPTSHSFLGANVSPPFSPVYFLWLYVNIDCEPQKNKWYLDFSPI